jgi:hypothetical protein
MDVCLLARRRKLEKKKDWLGKAGTCILQGGTFWRHFWLSGEGQQTIVPINLCSFLIATISIPKRWLVLAEYNKVKS